MTGSAEPPPQQPPQPQQQHTTYTSETEGDGDPATSETEPDGGGRTEPVAAPPAPAAALASAAAPTLATTQRGNKKASPPAAPDFTSLSAEPTDSQSTQSTVAAPPFRPLATAPFPLAFGSRGSVKIRKHCAGLDTAHLIPDIVDSRLNDEDWLCVPFAELEKQYKVQCTKCSFTFDITREAAERQQKELTIETGGRATIEL